MSTPAIGGPHIELDPFAPRLAAAASGLLRDFNRAGILAAADVHVARRLGALADESAPEVLLAVALAVRAPRLGHVHVDLARIRETAAVDTEEPVDLGSLPWPEPGPWLEAVAASGLVGAQGGDSGDVRPLRHWGSWLYLDRYWAEEVTVAAALQARSGRAPAAVDPDRLRAGLERLFGADRTGRQGLAAAAAVLQSFAVVAGGPGTGKTTTVARIVALVSEQAEAAGRRLPLVALAAPTGKAAARLQEAVHDEAGRLDVSPAIREQLLELRATTLHRLLGWRPGSFSRFRHDRRRRLAHDIVIVDETSMVSLSLMARLIDALRDEARLVLVGDPGQLASIEAGAVLGDIVGPAADGPRPGRAAARALSAATGATVTAGAEREGPGYGDGIVVLERVHRFGGEIAQLATAIRHGDGERVLALLRAGVDEVLWIETADGQDSAPGTGYEAQLAPVRERALSCAREIVTAAQSGDGPAALQALGRFRILCAHRRGPHGVASWTARIENWLQGELPGLRGEDRWYIGRPLLVTQNDYELGLHNGDTGVVIDADGRRAATFARGGEAVPFSTSRLGTVETVYAMTIHKSQGSQFEAAAVLLPAPDSRLLTRELLYTAATRAQRRLIVAGSEAAVRTAVNRPVARASGLRRRLWDEAPG